MYGMNGPESSWWNGALESLGWQIANTKQETWRRPDSPFLNVSDKPLGPPRFLPPMLKKTVGWSIWLTGVVVLVIWYVTALPKALIVFMSHTGCEVGCWALTKNQHNWLLSCINRIDILPLGSGLFGPLSFSEVAFCIGILVWKLCEPEQIDLEQI